MSGFSSAPGPASDQSIPFQISIPESIPHPDDPLRQGPQTGDSPNIPDLMVEAIESMKSHDLVKLLHSLSSLLSPTPFRISSAALSPAQVRFFRQNLSSSLQHWAEVGDEKKVAAVAVALLDLEDTMDGDEFEPVGEPDLAEAMARLRRRRREEKYEMELQKVVVQNGPKPDAAEPGGGNQKVDSSPQFKRQWGDGNMSEGQELATSRGKGEDAQHF